MKLYCITGDKQYDITPIVGDVSWRSSIDELGVQLEFSVAFNDERYFPIVPVALGSLILFENTESVFQGIVVSEQRNGRADRQYICFDYAFYLNKSKEAYQFKNMPANKAIESILSGFNFKCDVSVAGHPITLISHDKAVSDTIKEILQIVEQETGKKYRMEMQNDILCIKEQSELLVEAYFSLSGNLAQSKVGDAIANPTRKISIENTKNSIKVISSDSDKVKVEAVSKDGASISKYGLLQEVVSVSDKDIVKAKEIAKNTLAELSKPTEENSIEVIGSDKLRAGRLVEIKETTTGMDGKYLIESCEHIVSAGIHRTQLNLGVV